MFRKSAFRLLLTGRLFHPRHNRVALSISLGLILATVSSMVPEAVAASKRVSNGQIIQINGDVQLKRSHGRVISPKAGTRVYPEDKLVAANGAQVIVQCADLSTLLVEGSGENQLNGCASPEEAQCTPGTYKCPYRKPISLNDSSIPYIISPRRTNLLNDKPTLRWNSVAGATSYTVSITGEGVNWKTQVSDTQIVYPGEQPLQPGGYYLLIVTADTGASSIDDKNQGLGFSLLEATQAQQVRSQAQEIAQQPWIEQAKTLALVNLYLDNGLTFEAVEMLENLVNSGVETAPIYNSIGKLYLNFLALVPEAKPYYAKAVELADSNDIEEQAAAQEGLGQVQAMFGNQDEAIRLLTLARDGYEVLGDSERVSKLEKQLRGLGGR